MPVRIGTGTGAVDPSALRVAGVSPTRIMVGTGSAAVEVWSAELPRLELSMGRTDTTLTNVDPANTWVTVASHTNDSTARAASGQVAIEWARAWGDQTYGIRLTVGGTQVAYSQISGGGAAYEIHYLTIGPDVEIPAGAALAIQARTSDPYAGNNRRYRKWNWSLY